jgi:hypothetical protein
MKTKKTKVVLKKQKPTKSRVRFSVMYGGKVAF